MFEANYMRHNGHFQFMKLLPAGIRDFISVYNRDCYFVDKSMLMEQNTEV